MELNSIFVDIQQERISISENIVADRVAMQNVNHYLYYLVIRIINTRKSIKTTGINIIKH